MANPSGSDDPGAATLFERWQTEQRSWQQMIIEYVDKASTDEAFLTNLGNAMRGSLMANKPYPGTSPGAKAPEAEGTDGAALDEILFAVRRLEGQVLDLTLTIESLRTGSAVPSGDE